MKKIYLIAAVAAIITGLLLYFYLQGLEKEAAAPPVEYETVVVAAVDIPAYSTITEEMLTTAQVPAGSAHVAAARRVDQAVDQVTESALVTGEQVIISKLKSVGTIGDDLSYRIPEGMRAMTISVDAVSGLGGGIIVGDLVDVLVNVSLDVPTGESDPETGEEIIGTKIMTLNAVDAVEVLALGDRFYSAEGDSLYSSLTLLMTPEDCATLYSAMNGGSAQILLRQRFDDTPLELDPVTKDDLID